MNDWKTTFDKQFDVGYDNQGIRFRLEEDHIERAIPLSVVKEFIASLLSSQLKEVLGIIEIKKIQPEYVGRDNVDISYFVNSALDKVKAELSQLAEGEEIEK